MVLVNSVVPVGVSKPGKEMELYGGLIWFLRFYGFLDMFEEIWSETLYFGLTGNWDSISVFRISMPLMSILEPFQLKFGNYLVLFGNIVCGHSFLSKI